MDSSYPHEWKYLIKLQTLWKMLLSKQSDMTLLCLEPIGRIPIKTHSRSILIIEKQIIIITTVVQWNSIRQKPRTVKVIIRITIRSHSKENVIIVANRDTC